MGQSLSVLSRPSCSQAGPDRLTDMTSRYPCMRMMAEYLWADDLANLAMTNKTIRNNIQGSLATPGMFQSVLLSRTLRGNGSNGRAWQSDWRGQRQTNAIEQLKDAGLAQVVCQSQTIGQRASRPCHVCGTAVCDVRQPTFFDILS